MIDHDAARRLMAEAMEGRLGNDDERELALHLVGCQDCKQLYEALQQANPALTALELGTPSTEALDAAVHRATTVLRGEADPGPMGLTEEMPRLPDVLDPNTIRIDSAAHVGEREDPLVPAGPLTTTGPMASAEGPTGAIPIETSHVRAIEPSIDEPFDFSRPQGEEVDESDDDISVPDFVAGETGPPAGPAVIPPPVSTPLGVEPPLGVDPAVGPPAAGPGDPAYPVYTVPERRRDIDTLLDEDRARYEPLPIPDEIDEPERMNPGPWLVAIAVTIAVAVLAGVLITRGGGLFGGADGDLPEASDVRRRVEQAFTDMKSLKAEFSIQKLNLYRLGRDENSLTYRFTNGRYTGRMEYDRAEGYKQNFSLDVENDEVERAEIVQTSDETRSLLGAGDERSLLIDQNPPLGPPDGNHRPWLGLLEDSLGSAARIIAGSRDLEVLGVTERDGRELYEVRGTVRPTELTRADQIEAALDANRFLPVMVKRSISRENARFLGPRDVLTDEAINKAFGENDRVTTEFVELEGVQYDEIVLPGDLIVDAPEGVQEQRRDARFERVTRAEIGDRLDYEPLLPRSLPEGYEEQHFAHYTGEPQAWGPGGAYPKAQSVFHSTYFDGKTTIAVTQRRLPARFNLESSPLARAGLPITTRSVTQDEKEFFYGISPEVPPHVYGFLGNVFVVAVGYAPEAELLRIVASLAETPAEVPGPLDVSPSPTGSPGASPLGTPFGSPTATPAATAPTGGLPGEPVP